MNSFADNPDLLMMVTFAAALVMIAAILFAFIDTRGGNVGKRIKRLKHRFMSRDIPEDQINVKRIASEGWIKGLEVVAGSLMPRPDQMRARLMKTGRDIPFGNYLIVNLGAAIATGLLTGFLFRFPWSAAVAAGLACGVGLPHFIVGRMISRRANKFVTYFPDAIDLMVRGLRSGLPITESMASVAQEIPDPVGGEFRRIADGIRLGQTMDEALWETSNRLNVPEFKFFVISLSIQRETGGNLAETLQNLTDVLRKRQQMKLKIKAMSSEARASALIIGALPFIMFGILLMLNYDYTSLLLTDPRGMMMAGIGLISMGIGMGVIAKMVRFEI